MRLLQHKGLDLRRVKPAFAKVRAAIEAGDFKSADVKKLHVGPYYRAKLDHSNRLLLQFARHGGETVCLALEVIENHACDAGPLSLPDYLALGPRQSLLAPAAREAAHALFGRYQQWLANTGQFDLNLVAHVWCPLAQGTFDFMVIDEVQDIVLDIRFAVRWVACRLGCRVEADPRAFTPPPNPPAPAPPTAAATPAVCSRWDPAASRRPA